MVNRLRERRQAEERLTLSAVPRPSDRSRASVGSPPAAAAVRRENLQSRTG